MKSSSVRLSWKKRFFSAFILSLVSFFFINLGVTAWSPPVGDPPNNNTSEPIDVSINPSTKTGMLQVGSLKTGIFKFTNNGTLLISNDLQNANKTPAIEISQKSADQYYQVGINANVSGSHGLNVGGTVNSDSGFCINNNCVNSFANTGYWNVGTGGIYYASSTSPNVGIGTNAPTAQLDVVTALATNSHANNIVKYTNSGTARFEQTSTGLGKWYLNSSAAEVGSIQYSTPGGSPGLIFFRGVGPTYSNNSRVNLIYWSDYFSIGHDSDEAGSNQLYIKKGGNVGVGTTAPAYKLHVAGSVNATQLCINGDCRSNWTATGGESLWSANGSDIYRSTGNVSVGTSAANERFNVSGNIQLTSSGGQFKAYNEDSVKLKHVNWYLSNNDQWGQGQLWHELWFGGISGNSIRRIGFYLDVPDKGGIGAVGSAQQQATNGRMYIDTSGVKIPTGNLGVGTMSPTSKLTVSGTANITTSLAIGKPTTEFNSTLDILNSSGKNAALFRSNTSDVNNIWNNAGIGIFQTNNTNNNYGLVTFYNANGADTAGIAVKYVGHDPVDPVGDFLIYTANQSSTRLPRLYIKAGGNVGIGTTNPSYKLEVAGGLQALLVSNDGLNGSDKTTFFSVKNGNPSPTSWDISVGGNGNGLGYVNGEFYIGANGKTFIVNNKSAGGESMRIDSVGNVGIGVRSPGAGLEVGVASGAWGAHLRFTRPALSSNIDVRMAAANDGLIFRNFDTTATKMYSFRDYADKHIWDLMAGGRSLFNEATDNLTSSVQIGGADSLDVEGKATIMGNVGIGTTAPTHKLTVSDSSSGPIIAIVGSTTSYRGVSVRNVSGGGENWFYGANNSNNFVIRRTVAGGGGDDITIDSAGDVTIAGTLTVDKINVGTNDPPYKINNKIYSTYGASMIGLKEEHSILLTLKKVNDRYEAVIDFKNQKEGSDLWLFAKVSNIYENIDQLNVQLTPSFVGDVWYEKDLKNKKVYIYALPTKKSSALEVSVRLTAPRYDYEKWSNESESDKALHDLDEFYSN